jgi:hypothetical protein
MKKALNIGIYIVFIMAFGIVFYGAYLLFYPIKYYESKQPYRIVNENKEVRVGENLIYEVEYCKYIDYLPQRVIRSLVNGFVYDLPVSTAGNFPKGCRTTQVNVPMIVPDSLAYNHEYHMQITVDYKLNILRTETRTFETEDFILLPPK